MVDKVREPTELTGFFLRLIWLMGGNAVLFLLLVSIAINDHGLLSPASLGFWMVVGLVVVARYVDVTRYAGTTCTACSPATLQDVKRFSAGVVVIASAGWALAHTL